MFSRTLFFHLSTGTKNIIQACQTCSVKTLIYTSSSGVVFDGVHGLLNVDESTPYPEKVATHV
jgi:sterol-4alpha-carboxylate 3-dehydrogenase (decarboxylating)